MKYFVTKAGLWLLVLANEKGQHLDRWVWTNDPAKATAFADEATAGWWQQRLRAEIEVAKEPEQA
jgi:hypothetical protein